jgi:hypothetical protein
VLALLLSGRRTGKQAARAAEAPKAAASVTAGE